LAGFDVDIQELLEAVLTHDGYLVSIFAADTSSVDEVARASPQAVILSTGVSTGPIRLLDALLVPAGCRRAGRAERELMLRWTQQIRLVEPFRDLAGYSLREFLDNLPRLLHALVVVLRRDAPPDVLARDSDVQMRARSHAAVRLDAALPVDAVVREYQVLREVITRHLEQHLPAEAVVKVLQEVNWLLDDVIRTTVAEYVVLMMSQSATGVSRTHLPPE
jgi:hypothetical protein